VTLEDGSQVKGFVAEPRAMAGARDITHMGGWRAYIASL
jgi:allophanate hydrolase